MMRIAKHFQSSEAEGGWGGAVNPRLYSKMECTELN
jgi:hypothetical protein